MLGILIINDQIRKQIKSVLDYAAHHPIVIDPKNPTLNADAGHNPQLVLLLPVDFKCVFSHEIQRGITFKHFSVSRRGRLPHPEAVNMLLEEFGFRHRVMNPRLILWEDKHNQAINCIETLNKSDEEKVFTK